MFHCGFSSGRSQSPGPGLPLGDWAFMLTPGLPVHTSEGGKLAFAPAGGLWSYGGMSDGDGQNTAERSSGYLIVVGGLLLVICAALAVLWMAERTRRIRAEVKVMRMQQTLDKIFIPPQDVRPGSTTRPRGR